MFARTVASPPGPWPSAQRPLPSAPHRSSIPLPNPPSLRPNPLRHRQSRLLRARRALHEGNPETPQCGFSRAAIQILGLQGVNPDKFAAFNVLEDPELREGIKEYSDWPTIPQLYVEKDFIGGTDILVSMHQNGDLAKLFDEKKVILEGEPEQKE
ncbi:Monothiol glutaredoxin-5, mitochondrial [Fusarium culmorum]|uniref:Monothiol glutaredoxin-5, mitochondrial n=1 Tax=Fusarium culmorum TaxID=5516 RepID=A0A2T4GXE8_FUSCU|nr:Monothiol glutaredoxin-5, mitochondrial [Fusarium culmorum]